MWCVNYVSVAPSVLQEGKPPGEIIDFLYFWSKMGYNYLYPVATLLLGVIKVILHCFQDIITALGSYKSLIFMTL